MNTVKIDHYQAGEIFQKWVQYVGLQIGFEDDITDER